MWPWNRKLIKCVIDFRNVLIFEAWNRFGLVFTWHKIAANRKHFRFQSNIRFFLLLLSLSSFWNFEIFKVITIFHQCYSIYLPFCNEEKKIHAKSKFKLRLQKLNKVFAMFALTRNWNIAKNVKTYDSVISAFSFWHMHKEALIKFNLTDHCGGIKLKVKHNAGKNSSWKFDIEQLMPPSTLVVWIGWLQ